MKLVRESINEIKQDKEFGLSSIGIGRKAVQLASDTLKKMMEENQYENLKHANETKNLSVLPDITRLLKTKPENILLTKVNHLNVSQIRFLNSLFTPDNDTITEEHTYTKNEEDTTKKTIVKMIYNRNRQAVKMIYTKYTNDEHTSDFTIYALDDDITSQPPS